MYCLGYGTGVTAGRGNQAAGCEAHIVVYAASARNLAGKDHSKPLLRHPNMMTRQDKELNRQVLKLTMKRKRESERTFTSK